MALAAKSTWEFRELPILRAIVDAAERGEDLLAAGRKSADLASDEFNRCVASLVEAGFLEGKVISAWGRGIVRLLVTGVTERARKEVGVWPDQTTKLEEKRRRRFLLAKRIYEETDGNTMATVDLGKLEHEFGWTHDEMEVVAVYLEGEGLIEFMMGNQASITHQGIVELERSLQAPDQSTDHFPAINLLYVAGNVDGSNLQVGTTAGSQSVSGGLDIEALRAVLDAVAALSAGLPPGPDRVGVEAQAATIEAQLASPSPNHRVIHTALMSLRAIAESAAGSAAFAGLIVSLHHVVG